MNSIPMLYQNKEECCGCGACVNVCPKDAIRFMPDEYGFLYPKIDTENCIGCQKCVSACDFQKKEEVFGYTPEKAFAAIHKDKKVLKASSSGGVFSVLAKETLKEEGVVYGCILDNKLEAVHTYAKTWEEILPMRGSKYVQSRVDLIYREVLKHLEQGKIVLFTGTPCQVAALNSVLNGKQYDTLLTVDLVCHGTPSPLMFRKYIDYLEKKYHVKITNYSFRGKEKGWAGYCQSFGADDKQLQRIGKLDEFYISNFSKGNFHRPSCYQCRYACTNRVADITIGDFWGHMEAGIQLKNWEDGLSVCLINSIKGQNMQGVLEEQMELEETEVSRAVSGNRNLYAPSKKGEKYEAYMSALLEDEIESIANEYVRENHKKIKKHNRKIALKMMLPRVAVNRGRVLINKARRYFKK